MTLKRTAFAVLFVCAAIVTIWLWTTWPADVAAATLIGALFVALLSLIRLMSSLVKQPHHAATNRRVHR